MLDLIEEKAEGEEISMPEPEEEEGAPPDLMAALEASLAEARGSAKSNGRSGTPRKPARKTAARKRKAKSRS